MSGRLPRVSFVVPARGDSPALGRCLAAIERNDYPAGLIEAIVVLQNDTTHTAAAKPRVAVTVLTAPAVAPGELRNRGVRAALGEVVAFVDSDHEIDAGWTRAAVEALREASVGAVGSPYHAPVDGSWVQRIYDGFRSRKPGCRDVEWVAGGNLAMRREIFDRVRGFDATLETCEDVDLCQRIRAAGLRVVSDERLRSVHFGDPATLEALFFGELWRGRDNLRVSLRGPLSLGGMPSILVPIANLACLAAGLGGIAAAPFGGLTITLAAAALIGATAAIRAGRILFHSPAAGLPGIPQALAVASVYEIARALALVARASHQLRRRASPA